MVRHNNMVPNGHFHKDWQRYVKLNFNQPFKKARRHLLRSKKIIAKAPRPVDFLRPMVHCPSTRYNTKIRSGKGFSLQELKAVMLQPHYAATIGISVDFRRKNKSYESVLVNSQRLKTYLSKLLLFPKNNKKDEQPTPIVKKMVGKHLNKIHQRKKMDKARVPTEEEKKFQAFITLRKARSAAKSLSRKIKRKNIITDQFDDKK